MTNSYRGVRMEGGVRCVGGGGWVSGWRGGRCVGGGGVGVWVEGVRCVGGGG